MMGPFQFVVAQPVSCRMTEKQHCARQVNGFFVCTDDGALTSTNVAAMDPAFPAVL